MINFNLGYGMAEIVSLERFSRLRDTIPGKLWITSGDYNGIHPRHIISIIHGSTMCHSDNPHNRFVVVVNGDNFLRDKKVRPFMDLKTRCQIVSGIKGVDEVVWLKDTSFTKAIKGIRPDVFVKGGDRNRVEDLSVWEACKALGVEIITNAGI